MPALPPPSAHTLLDQLRASLGSDNAFLWRERLLQERLIRNITEKQERILLYIRELVDGGLSQFGHAEVATTCQVGVGTVKDALRRAQGIGLLDWKAEYRPGPNGCRRRTANTYQMLMPQRSPEPRPDLRRRAALVSKKPLSSVSKPPCAPQCGEPGWRPPPGWEARFAAKLAEEKRRWIAPRPP